MKKFSLTKIVSFALVCAMLMGAFMFTTVSAEDAGAEPVVKIAFKNVNYGEKYQLLFAIDAPEGAVCSASWEGGDLTVSKFEKNPVRDEEGNNILDGEGNIQYVDYIEVGGVQYKTYVVDQGVAAQAIDEVITLTVTYDEYSDTQNYSILQYVHERLYVESKKATDENEIAMLEALLAYANASDAYFNPDDEAGISDLVYVSATDCTFDGNDAGMVKAGTNVTFVSSIEAGDGKVINFEVTNLETNSVTTISAAAMAESGYTVNGPVSVEAVEGDADVVIKQYKKVTSADEITDGQYVIIIKDTNYALDVLNSGWITVTTNTVVDGDVVTDTANAVWTLTVSGTSVKLQDNSGVFVGPNGGNTNGIKESEYNWNFVWDDANDTITFNGTGSDTVILAANKSNDYKLRGYKSTTVTGNAAGYPSTFYIYKLS